MYEKDLRRQKNHQRVSIRQSISDAFDRECIKIKRPMSHIIEDLIIEWIAKQVSNKERDPGMVEEHQL